MRTIISALALLLLSDLAVAVEPGVYYCVTERMAGIQADREAKEGEDIRNIPRFAGSIKPNKEKFIVKIRPVDENKRKTWCEGYERHKATASRSLAAQNRPERCPSGLRDRFAKPA